MDWKMTKTEWQAWMADKPILRHLHEERVVSLGILKDGSIGFQEECDQYFSAALTPDGLSVLIQELEAVRDSMRNAETKET
jgi:hypothetical protein